MIHRLVCQLLILLALAGPAWSHALEPGFLELRRMGGDDWRAVWKVPQVEGQPMEIEARLPETCTPRGPPEPRFTGTFFVSEWVATCPDGIEGGEIRIAGLELTLTDTLVRYETTEGRVENQRLTSATTSFIVPSPQGPVGVLVTYGLLGINHILNGIDHLLFVFALILLVRNRRHLLAAITAFTVAHSLSLAAAALGWLVVPARPVEAVVALSIMYLAAEILRPGDTRPTIGARRPWVVAFAFGLLHGLGFARALLDIGLPEGDVPLALLTFNIGVEIGQLLFIGLVLALGAALGRLYPVLVNPASGSRGRGVTAFLMGGTAAAWFVSRIAAF